MHIVLSAFYTTNMPCLADNPRFQIVAIYFLIWLSMVTAYPGGSPDVACLSMFPSGHSVAAQASPPPYTIFLPKSTYKPGETITIEIYGEKTYFKGLYVQARHVGCGVNTTRTIGVFTAPDPRLETRHCFGIVHSTVTHGSSLKKDAVSFYWTAPVIASGHLVIRATIVKDLSTFWVGVESAPLVDLKSRDPLFCKDGSSKALTENLNSDQNGLPYKTAILVNEEPRSRASIRRFMAAKLYTAVMMFYITSIVIKS